jgi:serine/threonine-protein kinase
LFRGDASKQKVEEVLLEDGDILRVGKTRLQVAIEIPRLPIKTHIYSDEHMLAVDGAMVDVRCIRCGRVITIPPSAELEEMGQAGFICKQCQEELAKQKEKPKEKKPPKKKEPEAAVAAKPYACMKCQASVADLANKDGQAEQLADVALYLCERCAPGEMEPDQKEKNIGNYQILSKLGEGGMGIVYKVRQDQTGRVAALKVTKSEVKGRDDGQVKRFLREMDILRHLSHPNLVRFYESGEHKGKPYFVSEFVTGGDLSQFVSVDGKTLLGYSDAVRLIRSAIS